MLTRTLFLACLVLWLGAPALLAQFAQYIPAGSLAQERLILEQAVEQGMEDARWQWGPLRLDPRFWVRNLAYVDNIFAATAGEETSDITASTGAGLVAYQPLGRKGIFSFYALPEYVWWADREELRELVGRYGVGLFGYFNHLDLELEGRRTETQQSLNSEATVPVDVQADLAAFGFQIDIRGSLAFFGRASEEQLRHTGDVREELPDLRLRELDRDERIVRGGLRLLARNGLRLGIGAEHSEVDFLLDPGGRSNSGTGPMLQVSYPGANFRLDASAVHRSLEFDSGAELDEVTGQAVVGWTPRSRFTVSVYGARTLVYSAVEVSQTYIEDKVGGSLEGSLHRRLSFNVFVETGSDEFSAEDPHRVDDFDTVGGYLRLDLGRRVSLLVGASNTDFRSNLPGFDRSGTVTYTTLTVGGLGTGDLPW